MVAELRLQGWFPELQGQAAGGNPWELGCPCLPQQIPTPSPGSLEHLNPSFRSCCTEEPLDSFFGEMPGTCWGRLFPPPSERMPGYGWALPGASEVRWSHPSPSKTCPTALQGLRLLKALLPGDGCAKDPGARSSETGLCLGRVPLGAAARSMWPQPWVTSPGEVWLWWCCPALWALDRSAARGGGE